MTAQQNNPYLTITLTDRPPVKIKKEEWPIIAESSDKQFDGQSEFQANRTSTWKLKVRQHEDGRALVYGIYSHDTDWQDEHNYYVRGGELVEQSGDLAAGVRRVGEWMAQQEQAEDDESRWESIINACIADLPAQDI